MEYVSQLVPLHDVENQFWSPAKQEDTDDCQQHLDDLQKDIDCLADSWYWKKLFQLPDKVSKNVLSNYSKFNAILQMIQITRVNYSCCWRIKYLHNNSTPLTCLRASRISEL